MKTIKPIEYKAVPYGHIATIPAGTTVTRARNLPASEGVQYWSKGWRGMTQREHSWQRNYGFLLTTKEVKGI